MHQNTPVLVTKYTSDVFQMTLLETDFVKAVYGSLFSPYSLCQSRSIQFNAMSVTVNPGCTAQV